MAATDDKQRGPSVSTRAFASFFHDRLRPVIDDVGKRKAAALRLAVAVAAAVFVLFGLAVYLFFSPYSAMMGDHNITFWPILILVPGTMAVIGFSITYILALRHVVRDFRENLVTHMAEYIDPVLVHDGNRRIADVDMRYSLLFFDSLGKPVSGADRFRGRAGDIAVEFTDLRLATDDDQTPQKADSGEKRVMLSGLFLRAVFAKPFRGFVASLPGGVAASISGLSEKLRDAGELGSELVRLDDDGGRRQVVVESASQDMFKGAIGPQFWAQVAEAQKSRDVRAYLSCRGNVLSIAMLAPRERLDAPGIFEGFDFANCREFCRDAKLCLELVKEIAGKPKLFVE